MQIHLELQWVSNIRYETDMANLPIIMSLKSVISQSVFHYI